MPALHSLLTSNGFFNICLHFLPSLSFLHFPTPSFFDTEMVPLRCSSVINYWKITAIGLLNPLPSSHQDNRSSAYPPGNSWRGEVTFPQRHRLLSWGTCDLVFHQPGSQRCLREWDMSSPLYDAPSIPLFLAGPELHGSLKAALLICIFLPWELPYVNHLEISSCLGYLHQQTVSQNNTFFASVFQSRATFLCFAYYLLLKFPFSLLPTYCLQCSPFLSVCTVLFYVSFFKVFLFLSALFPYSSSIPKPVAHIYCMLSNINSRLLVPRKTELPSAGACFFSDEADVSWLLLFLTSSGRKKNYPETRK